MVIDLSLTRRAEHSMLNARHPLSQLFQVSYFPRRPPGLPTSHKVLQKGEFKGWRIILVFHCHLDWLDRMGNEHKESGAEETVAAGGLGPVYPACTGLTPLSFHCCWFGTNPSNFLQRQDKMCLPYLYIYSTSHIPLFTLPFFSALACK